MVSAFAKVLRGENGSEIFIHVDDSYFDQGQGNFKITTLYHVTTSTEHGRNRERSLVVILCKSFYYPMTINSFRGVKDNQSSSVTKRLLAVTFTLSTIQS